ncbi:sulfite exporter TauE/SafE family protein [Oricola cellulosilytica]|uniref:sulfite exporter TauE/SafE family protein n=1 Tax=Oricola cellulosilytica TaxID=1429082 RepID=UPI001304F99F|nr:sulfite exporter TauE/SafE family protein [Oricola cellulosilytica]
MSLTSALSDAFSTIAYWQYALAYGVIAFAAIVQYRIGVGFGLFAAPVIALFAPELVPVPIIALTLFTATAAMVNQRNGFDWREIGWSVAGRFAGSLVAVAILAQLTDQKQFMLVFGLLIALAVAMSLAGFRFRFTRRLLFTMGAISGLTATITSVGGPPMAIAYQDQKPERARPNMSAFFALGCVIVLAVRQVNGFNTTADLVHSIVLLPALFIGIKLAPAFEGVIDRNFRTMLLVVCGLSALLLIWRALA